MTFNRLFIKATTIAVMLSCLMLQACGEKGGVEGRPTQNTKPVDQKPGGDGNGDDNNPPQDLTCEQKWEELVALSPKGLETSHQKSQTMVIKNETTILTQSIIEKIFTENNGALLEWQEDTKLLAPEEGKSSSTLSIKKETYLNLCNKKIKFSYTDRPPEKTPTETKKMNIPLGDNTYEVDYENYDLSKNKEPINKDTLEIWIGAKDPYKGVLFESKRVYLQLASGQIATMTLSKKILTLKPVEK